MTDSETETDTEEEEVKEEKDIITKWVKYIGSKNEIALLKKSTFHWKEAITNVYGCCSVDAVAVAFDLPRNPQTWSVLRTDVATFNSTGAKDQIAKLQPNEHLEIDDLAYITLARFKTIPIIMNDEEARKQQANASFAISGVYYTYVNQLKKSNKEDDIPVRYVIFRYKFFPNKKQSKNQFQQVGVGHFVTLGIQRENHIQTMFAEQELPKQLLESFNTEMENLRSFYTMPLSERRKNRKKTPVEADVTIIE